MIERMTLGGTPYIGIIAYASDKLTVVRTGLPDSNIEIVGNVMKTDVLPLTMARTDLVGIFLAGNSNGVVVPYSIEPNEHEALSSYSEVLVLDTKFTAMGNLMVANDHGCVIGPELSPFAEELSSFLGVEVHEGIISGHKNVGSVAKVTNKGCLVHPETTPDKQEWLSEVLKVPVRLSTANRGVGYLGGCMIANSYGVVVGDISTGPELGRIDDVFMEGE